ncbi:hypothetical protein HNP84_002649 [Thermocatellispora tengchongensis]|uniref:Uncharacterized protein n=1 Tax=Thermocatellispora tengchongensis TaxID=1073253 RepID=A0A840NZL6_9ACTN|nr:hypothetical protein [Thermocatellispora tengchongensis]MBB5132928.1 hypothetical protein [Thermocatellispora tengchongensis]
MNHREGEDDAKKPRLFMALPGRVEDQRPAFHRHVAALLRLIGEEVPAETPANSFEWEHAARAAVSQGLSAAGEAPEAVFDALILAAVYDPNPSFNRRFVEPAVAYFGRRRVQAALVEVLRGGTNSEKAGAARAWYWAQPSLRYRGAADFAARKATEESQREYDALEDLRMRWREAALREFVANEDLDLRRCILPGLDLDPSRYPPELRDLVSAAVHIARTHPDEYIRHRVEHQV